MNWLYNLRSKQDLLKPKALRTISCHIYFQVSLTFLFGIILTVKNSLDFLLLQVLLISLRIDNFQNPHKKIVFKTFKNITLNNLSLKVQF